MTPEKLKEILTLSLGEASALFMSQGDTKSEDIVMPSRELKAIVDRACESIQDAS